MSYYDEHIDAEDFNELVCKIDAVSNVVSILIEALGENHADLQKMLIKNIQAMAEGLRNTLGEVNEDDIAEYAHSVAENMELLLPFSAASTT